MVHVLLSPEWFFGYDVVMELLFAIVTLLVASAAFRIFKTTGQSHVRYLGISFGLISFSYFVQSLLNFLIITEANKNICDIMKVKSVLWFNLLGVYVHIFFMLVGLSLLAFMTFKSENVRSLFLLTILVLLSVFMHPDPVFMYLVVASLLLFFISLFFARNFLRRRKTNSLLIAVAFLLLLFGKIHYIFTAHHEIFFAVAHMLELIAYLLILANFFMVRRKNEPKKRKT